jgi:hypothetical protein
MRHSAYRTLPDEAIEPTITPPGGVFEKQCKALSELRALQNAISAAQLARDECLAAFAQSGMVSRRDMARACGLNKSRIDQIIAASVPGRAPSSRLPAHASPVSSS